MAVETPRTLFVDDDAEVLVGIRDVLRRRRLSILTATSGVEALSIIDREAVAVVVSDERMPEMLLESFEQGRRRLRQLLELGHRCRDRPPLAFAHARHEVRNVARLEV